MVSTHKYFPLHLWCRLLPQAIVTLNLLRTSRINPTLLAHAQLHGLFDFNATPFAPPGTKVIVHIKTKIRKSWAPMGQYGWYIDRDNDHYRCYKLYIPETRALIQPEKVEFLPQNCKMPFQSSAENATIAATELIHALRNPAPAAPYAHIGDVQLQALDKLSEMFQHTTVQPEHQVTTETATQSPGIPPRVSPKLPRVNIPTITKTPDQESLIPHLPNQSEQIVHIITPDKPTPTRVEKRNHQQEAPSAPPIMPKIATSSAPSTHRYPFRHPRQKLPAVISARYANATKYSKQLEANVVLNTVTGVLQEFLHLIK